MPHTVILPRNVRRARQRPADHHMHIPPHSWSSRTGTFWTKGASLGTQSASDGPCFDLRRGIGHWPFLRFEATQTLPTWSLSLTYWRRMPSSSGCFYARTLRCWELRRRWFEAQPRIDLLRVRVSSSLSSRRRSVTPATATTGCIARYADSLTGPRCVPCFVWLIPARSESGHAVPTRCLAPPACSPAPHWPQCHMHPGPPHLLSPGTRASAAVGQNDSTRRDLSLLCAGGLGCAT